MDRIDPCARWDARPHAGAGVFVRTKGFDPFSETGRGRRPWGYGGTVFTGFGPQRAYWGEWERAFVVADKNVVASKRQVLPYGVYVPGMAGNILFRSWPALAVLGLLVSRRMIRWIRGRCLVCGYPRARSGVCTECGG